mgnify:CR=1 FL=1
MPAQIGTRLLEYTSSANMVLRVDRERSMIHGVKVLGRESRNGRIYTKEALAAATRFYESRPVNVDHVDGARRSYRDRIGKLSRIEHRDDGLYGDLQVNPKHPLAEQLFWDAEHSPESVGLSHDAQARTAVRDGQVIVEQIHSVRSVDLVAEPATSRGLYEDVDPDGGTAVADDEPDDEPEKPTDIDKLPDEAFALVLPGGVKIGNRTHPLSKRYWPLDTAERVTRALDAIEANRKLAANHRKLAMQRARDAAKKFGMQPSQTTEELMEIKDLTLEALKESRPDLVTEILASGDAEKELIAIREDRDKLQRELTAIRTKEAVAKALTEAKIDPAKVPASLMESIVAASEEHRKTMIADLAKLLEHAPAERDDADQHPVSRRQDGSLPVTFEDRVRAWSA